jgi:ATP phosphoribosyltransferase
VTVAARLNFGPAKVIVAVPDCWLDVASMADLDDVAEQFYRAHGRRLRVATKYQNLTRRFFAEKGVTGYRILESLGATEGAPAAGSAELIVDITTTGSTLAANHLRILDDGLILDSCAVLAMRGQNTALAQVLDKLRLVVSPV